MSEQEYRKHPAVSQSTLKSVLKNDFSQPPHSTTLLGNLVDTLIYGGDMSKWIVGATVPARYDEWFTEHGKDCLRFIRETGYYDNRKDDWHLEKIEEYFPKWEKTKGLLVYTPTDLLIAEGIVEDIKESSQWQNSRNENKYQLPLFGKIGETEIKGLLDDYSPGVIYDLKVTESKLSDWQFIAKKLRYEFQMSFYRELVSQNFEVDKWDIKCRWIVYSIPERRVGIFEASENDLEVGEWGNKWLKGWRQAIEIFEKCKDKPDYFLPYYEEDIIKLKLYE